VKQLFYGTKVEMLFKIFIMKKIPLLLLFASLFSFAQEKTATMQEPFYKSITNKKIRHNSIAILPILFMDKEIEINSIEMGKLAQQEIETQLYEIIDKDKFGILDHHEMQKLLNEAKIDINTLHETPISELQNILGVDHLLFTKIYFSKDIRQVSEETEKKEAQTSKVKTQEFSFEKKYFYTVYMDVYKNEKLVFKKTKSPFFFTEDSWMLSTKFLLKSASKKL
jgi:hypothetical protein